ncbi:hypothetical protein BDN70DRAFT_930462 [Pholiota conissans]|uniref:F-box domain-containing protein n=1 Tax=Pholiota conissans TaxID=109636 RepID=A0A9P5Z9J8_9AGAR|nr:hypothetical protein BDN70DRAFT_930462 [Pholiota conissans]
MPFLTLPRDVIDKILHELPVVDMLTCLSVNKYLNEVLTDSIRLKLKIQLWSLGAESNPFVKLSPFERLRQLNKSTDNWKNLTPEFIYSINIPTRAAVETIEV